MITSLNHIGIAVRDLDASKALYQKIFNVDKFHTEVVEEQKVSIASFKVGDVLLELTAPTSPDSPIAKFLDKRGEGIHHIAFASDSVSNELSRLSDEGISLVNNEPRHGAHDMLIAFLHPKSTGGVLMELCEPIVTNEK
ncbi:MAG: methylmalonyl-CoA epimerase [Ignavibacteria bacterium]|nr:methylmalonyl-CoA epimerase [Ignavibacteria bacterium]